MSTTTDRSPGRGKMTGSAALEALMLVVFLIVPMWMLLFNMGYAGARLQDAQAATRLAVFEVLGVQTAGEDANSQRQLIANRVRNRMFPREESEDAVQLSIDNAGVGNVLGPENDGLLNVLGGALGALSGDTGVSVSVRRESPFEQFADTPITVPLVVGGTPYTYCEMDNADFNPLAGENIGLGIIEIVTGSASLLLAPFGGLPLGDDKC